MPGLAWLDRVRRGRGALLDAAGFGPVEAPWREALRAVGARLRAYGEPGPGPVLLLVPAPIKRHHVWDLAPGRSVVRRALAAGLNVGLLEWTGPEGDAAGFGLDDHADRLVGAAVDALAALHGSRGVLLAGHSLGGTLAAVFAALHPDRVRGLALVEAPLRFGPGAGVLGALAAAAPSAPEAVRAAFGPAVPGSVLSALGVAADPVEFLPARWLDALASAADPEALAAHLRVVRWTLDELAMPGRLFGEVAGRLCRDDAFARGALEVAGRPARPGRLRMPVLAVVDPLSRLAPPASVLPVLGMAGRAPTVLHHREDGPGVALRHVGALVGRAAHERLWPAILEWAGAAWAGGGGAGRHEAPRAATAPGAGIA
jgi:polyhydroxyalkanoate synthase subunit PhaC